MEIILQVVSKTTREIAVIMETLNSLTGKKTEATSRYWSLVDSYVRVQ